MDGPNNVWQFLIVVASAIESHGTRIIGGVMGTLSVLGASGIIPTKDFPYYMASMAILTYWRGQGNADKIAEKVIAKTQEMTK